MKKMTIALCLASALVAPPSRAEYQLPTYTYSIRSGDFTETDILRQSFDRLIPGTTWLCSISVITSGLTATCRTPSAERQPNCNPPYALDADGNKHFRPECFASPREAYAPSVHVAIRASCAGVENDEQTVFLSNLDGGFARLSIGCHRLDGPDDGF